eukprot:gene18674-25192_t
MEPDLEWEVVSSCSFTSERFAENEEGFFTLCDAVPSPTDPVGPATASCDANARKVDAFSTPDKDTSPRNRSDENPSTASQDQGHAAYHMDSSGAPSIEFKLNFFPNREGAAEGQDSDTSRVGASSEGMKESSLADLANLEECSKTDSLVSSPLHQHGWGGSDESIFAYTYPLSPS